MRTFKFPILGLPEGSTEEEVRSAYREKCRVHHPDKGGDLEDFKKLQKEYKEALEDSKFYAAEPELCPDCDGTGKQTKKHGVTAIKIKCTTCNGTGEPS